MHNEQHDLFHEFPEYSDRIRALTSEDLHFRHLSDEYHALDRQVHRADMNVEPLSDEHAEELKKLRLMLKDELYSILKAA